MEVAVQKICCVCRRDVRQRKRTKDPRGNYYCTPCYETRAAAFRRQLNEITQQSEAAAVLSSSTAIPPTPPRVTATERPATPADASKRLERPARRWLSMGGVLRAMPIIACALVALCMDQSPHVRLAALLGLIVCAAIVAVTSGSGRMTRVFPRFRWRDWGAIAAGFGLSLLLGVAIVGLGIWRAGAWGGVWMSGAVVVAAMWWLARRRGRVGMSPAPLVAAAPEPSVVERVEQTIPPPIDTRPSTEVVEVQRRVPRRHCPRSDVRISDLLGAEAQAEVDAARQRPERLREPEVPVSPASNPPVTALVEDFAGLLPKPAPMGSRFDRGDHDDPFQSTPFRIG